MSLHGKTALVIRGSSGIGLTTARALVGAGARVIISSRSEEKLEMVPSKPTAFHLPCNWALFE